MSQKKETFEDHLRQVEDVVRSLESGKLGLEESIERYEQGMNALKKCYEILDAAEKKIQVLMKSKDGKITVKDLEGNGA